MYATFLAFSLSVFLAIGVKASEQEAPLIQLKSCFKRGPKEVKVVTFDDNMFVTFFKNKKIRDVVDAVQMGKFRVVKKKGSGFDYQISLQDEIRIPEIWDLERPIPCQNGRSKKSKESKGDNPEYFLIKAATSRIDIARQLQIINVMAGADFDALSFDRVYFELAIAQRMVALYSFGQIGCCETEENKIFFKKQFQEFLFSSLENYVMQADKSVSAYMFHVSASSFVKNMHAICHAAEEGEEVDYVDAIITLVGKLSSFLLVKINQYHQDNDYESDGLGCPDCQYIVEGVKHFRLAYN